MHLALLGLLALAVLLLIYKLGSLTPGLSPEEAAAGKSIISWHNFLQNPLFAPLQAVRYIVFTIFPSHGHTLTRLPAAIIGFGGLLAFARICRVWYGARGAITGTLLFMCSAAFLHSSRLASGDVLDLVLLPALLLIFSSLQRLPDNYPVAAICALGIAAVLYVPGSIWFVALALWFYRDDMVHLWLTNAGWRRRGAWLVLLLAPLVPLIYAFVQQASLVTTWLGAPQRLSSFSTILHDLVLVPVHIFVRGQPPLTVDHLPLVTIFIGAVWLVGLFFYVKHWQAGRSRMLGAWALVGAVLVALGGPVSLSALLPLVYLVAVAGVSYLLHQWMKIFPRNPLAKGFGYTLVGAAIALSCIYNLRAYFVAWPHTPETLSVYTVRR